jgi:pimeloyl-ACP methyl ester carboxylesterase
MSAVPPDTQQRSQLSKPDAKGAPTFNWQLTHNSISDTVNFVAKLDVLPVIFIPGIMGSNLCRKSDGKAVWRLDTTPVIGEPVGLLAKYGTASAGKRQGLLHPDRVKVDRNGSVPKHIEGIGDREAIRDRGWGEIAEGSYHEFLKWLEETINPNELNPAKWQEYFQTQATIGPIPKSGEEPKLSPGIRMGLAGEPFNAEMPFNSILTDDLLRQAKFWMPVHAVGYNWLASNQVAAEETLKPAIKKIIDCYNKGQFSCKQVILVTHSMGGLVARACAKLPEMEDKIAGVVHGVMPAVGASVAYRRCKAGMSDESALAGLVIGSNGREVTAVFAQAPGALQLLPSQDYPPAWLRVAQSNGVLDAWPKANPYEEIYRCRDKWWGLINEEWLSPPGGVPLKWETYDKNIKHTKLFHESLSKQYHPNTYVYYGADKGQKSFQKVTWRIKPGHKPDDKPGPSAQQVLDMSARDVRTDGRTPEYIGGQTEVVQTGPSGLGPGVPIVYESSYWELHCEMQDDVGDGTVPVCSGAAPFKSGAKGILQQFRLSGFDHEMSYNGSMTARRATLYAITKVAGQAKQPG